MTTHMMAFPVERGLQGMNGLARFLNAAGLLGLWHFAAGTRFDQTTVDIDFDDPSDAAPSWRRYCDSRKSGS